MSTKNQKGPSTAVWVDPARLFGKLDQFIDVKETLDVKGLQLGGYVRVSTGKEAQKTSLENQEKYIKEWAEVNGFAIYRVYKDVKGGQFANLRDEFQEMMDDIKAGKIKGIVTKEIARSSRDVMDILDLKRTLADFGCFFISIRENYDSRTDDDEFLLIIHAALAQKERKTTSSRVKVTQILKSKEGKGNVPPPYGYKYSPNKHYEPDPDKAHILRKIIDLFTNKKWGRQKICKYLNEKRIPGPRGGLWRTSSLKIILTNPAYTGLMVYNTTTLIRTAAGTPKRVLRPQEEWVIVENAHEALITNQEFEAIQELMNERRETDTRKTKTFERKYLLSGLLYCAVCGGKVYGARFAQKYSSKKDEGIEKEYLLLRYVCQAKNGKCDSKIKYWHMEKVDSHVFEELKTKVRQMADIEEMNRYLRERKDLFSEELQKERRERELLEEALAQNEKATRKQQVAFEEDIISTEEYKQRMTELRAIRGDLQLKLERLNKKLASADSAQELILSLSRMMMSYVDSLETLQEERKRELVESLVSRVELGADYSVKVKWSMEEEVGF